MNSTLLVRKGENFLLGILNEYNRIEDFRYVTAITEFIDLPEDSVMIIMTEHTDERVGMIYPIKTIEIQDKIGYLEYHDAISLANDILKSHGRITLH